MALHATFLRCTASRRSTDYVVAGGSLSPGGGDVVGGVVGGVVGVVGGEVGATVVADGVELVVPDLTVVVVPPGFTVVVDALTVVPVGLIVLALELTVVRGADDPFTVEVVPVTDPSESSTKLLDRHVPGCAGA